MSKRHIHDERIRALAAEGATLSEIARAIERTKSVAHAHLKRLGIDYARGKAGRKPGGIQDEQVRALYDQGASIPEMMRATGMCRGGVYNVLDRLGIQRPHRNGPSARMRAIIAARQQGKTFTEISCEFGITRNAAFYAVKRWAPQPEV
jgi:DNA invertase Pin-like site-specific DNA recombinase